VYDILAMRGGTRLYSRLAPLQMWASEAEGVPTAGMQQVLQKQEEELTALAAEARQFASEDIAAINQRATQLGLPFVIVGSR
jgi:DNA-binding transcriptional MerR regulator